MTESGAAPTPSSTPAPAASSPPIPVEAKPIAERTKKGQFVPGQSGNPAGRPKGVPNRNTALMRACGEYAKLTGKSFEMTLIEEAFRLSRTGDSGLLVELMKRGYITITPEAAGVVVNLQNNTNPTQVLSQYEGLVQALRASRQQEGGVDNIYENLGRG